MRRAMAGVAVAIGLTAVLGVAACTGPDGGPTSECNTTSAGAPGDAEPMLILGGLLPLVVYEDGAVAMLDESGSADDAAAIRPPFRAPGFYGDQPGQFASGTLTDCELATVIERADALFADGVDFGSPDVTDSSSTSVAYRNFQDWVYAFYRSDPTEWNDLTYAQQRARQDLADLWNFVEDSVELDGEPLPIDRLVVLTRGTDGIDVIDWPLDRPFSEVMSGGDCAVIDDPAEIDALVERLGQSEPMDEYSRIGVYALAPGLPACS